MCVWVGFELRSGNKKKGDLAQNGDDFSRPVFAFLTGGAPASGTKGARKQGSLGSPACCCRGEDCFRLTELCGQLPR